LDLLRKFGTFREREKKEALENVVKSQSILLLRNDVHVSERGRTTLMGLKAPIKKTLILAPR
jgi:hypothetical protein